MNPNKLINVLAAPLALRPQTGTFRPASASNLQAGRWDGKHSESEARQGQPEHTQEIREHVHQWMFGGPNIKSMLPETPRFPCTQGPEMPPKRLEDLVEFHVTGTRLVTRQAKPDELQDAEAT